MHLLWELYKKFCIFAHKSMVIHVFKCIDWNTIVVRRPYCAYSFDLFFSLRNKNWLDFILEQRDMLCLLEPCIIYSMVYSSSVLRFKYFPVNRFSLQLFLFIPSFLLNIFYFWVYNYIIFPFCVSMPSYILSLFFPIHKISLLCKGLMWTVICRWKYNW